MSHHSPAITGTTTDRISAIVSPWKGVINEAHSASYGIIIKVRKQPHRGVWISIAYFICFLPYHDIVS